MPTADELLGDQVALRLLESLRAAAPAVRFTSLENACGGLTGQALRERVDALADALIADVPGEFDALAGLVSTARDQTPQLDGWMVWPVSVALAKRAASEASPQALDGALDLLASLTSRLSSEFALRILLRADLPRVLSTAHAWAGSPDPHIRRLASEGTRPYLPWALRVPELTTRPEHTLPILDALYNDESEYVRRSVANHLNDLSRHAPEAVLQAAARWSEAPGESTAWVVRHGLRTLVKQGNAQALALLGYSGTALVVEDFEVLSVDVTFPGTLGFSARIRNDGTETARIALDYVVYHLRANGTQSPKTFKLTSRTLAPGQEIQVSREHKFREITTRRYYNGDHAVALQVNGLQTQPAPFRLSGVSHEK